MDLADLLAYYRTIEGTSGYRGVLWGDELLMFSWDDATRIDVFAHQPGPDTGDIQAQLLRQFHVDPGVIDHDAVLIADEAGVIAISNTGMYRIDRWTGEHTLIRSLPISAPRSASSAGAIDGELFIPSWYAGANAMVRVYDLATLEHKRDLPLPKTSYQWYLGAGAGAFDVDSYQVDVRAGDFLTISTRTPGDGALDYANDLDPVIDLYDPSGAPLAWDDNGAPDGRNSLLHFQAVEDGTYTVTVGSVTGARGDYVLEVTGHTGGPVPFAVEATTPPVGMRLNEVPSELTVRFSAEVRLSTLTAGDLTVNGRPALDVTVVDAQTISFALPVQGMGTFDVTMAPGAVLDTAGRPIAAFAGELIVSARAVGPEGTLVYSHQTVAEFPGPSSTFDIAYGTGESIRIIVAPTAPALHVEALLRDSSGALVASATGAGPGQAATLTATAASADLHSLIVRSVDDTEGAFDVAVVRPSAPESYSGVIVRNPEPMDLVLQLDAGQQLTAVISPTGAELQPWVELRDGEGTILASATSPGAGAPAMIQG
ncbi:hypothetical protein LCGC14_2090380, partial [marine sediment metagenome]